MNDKTTALAIILTCFVLTFFTTFWFNSFALPLISCILQVRSCFWLVSLFAFKWDNKSNPSFVVFFGVGVGLTVVGVLMLLLPLIGFTLFTTFYIVGTTCTLASILLLMEPLNIDGKVKGQVQTFMNDASLWDIWIKVYNSDIGIAVEDASLWDTCIKVYNSDIGIAVEGVFVLLFPTLGALFIAVFIMKLGGLLGFMGGLSSLGSVIGSIGNVARNIPFPRSSQTQSNTQNTQTQSNTQNMEKSQKLENLIRSTMKVLSLLIPGIVLWDRRLAILLWILRNLLAVLVKLLQCCPINVVYFIICFIFGAGCTILGIYTLFLPELGFYLFKILYTVGNICLLGSTLFLKGPEEQLEMMFDDTRKVATSLMLTCLVLTLLAAFWLQSRLLALVFSNLHILSSIWYYLSYIPCARYALKKITSYFI